MDVELYWSGLFAKGFLKGVNVLNLITNIESGVGAAPAADAAPAAEAKEEKKEEEPKASNDDMGYSLFD